MIEFRPALLTSLKHYSREKFTADLMAGIIVGIVALPLAIAFGIASGVSPEKASSRPSSPASSHRRSAAVAYRSAAPQVHSS